MTSPIIITFEVTGDNNQMTVFVFTFCAAPGKPGDNPGTDLGAGRPPPPPVPTRQKEPLLTLVAISYVCNLFSLNHMLLWLPHYFGQFLTEETGCTS